MRLSWNEIRTQAATFAEDWADARYERGEAQSFYNEFFEVFGVRRRQVAAFEAPVKKLGDRQGFIDLFWKGVLLVEHKSAGGSLTRAKEQALDYFPGLKPYELPRYILVSDFQTFELHDLETGEPPLCFALANLPSHVERFGFILGVERRTFRDQDPANILAAELMAKLHDALKESGYDGHPLERYLVRLLFCLFADDTGIFQQRDLFEDLIRERTAEDGSDLGQWLGNLWEVLNTPPERRQSTLDEDLDRFDYINGGLFEERLPIANFNAAMRTRLLEACGFAWDSISPAIFGSLFQAVMKPAERRRKGAHYTTERNILKVIQPLLLDDLRAEFERLKARRDTRRRAELEAFHDRLAALRFFDPACGCGNFLVITYRELRELETALLTELHSDTFNRPGLTRSEFVFDVGSLTKLNVDQFYGIELEEFPARIAEVALWMTDHIANNRLSLVFGRAYARIPLRTAPHIHNADALETDWAEVLAPAQCAYVLGNPPFVGAKMQTEAQRAQVRRIARLGGSGGTLDYVAAWFLKAGDYASAPGAGVRGIGFVATNSITQGEQGAQLWPILFDRCKLEIAFAHRTFAWGSDARGVAHVHVVVIGLARRGCEPAVKRLFSYDDIRGDPTESRHDALTAYLFGAEGLADPHLVVREESRPINGAAHLITGSKPIDGGHLILDDTERVSLLRNHPEAGDLIRPFVGADEFINGGSRWILALQHAPPELLRRIPPIAQRVAAVRAYRLDSASKPTRDLADTPTRFHVNVIPEGVFLVIPEVSSERREYLPIGWLEAPTIPSNLLRVLSNATLLDFAILTGATHMSWLRYIGGRLKSDYRYSVGLVYNTFPRPRITSQDRERLEALAQAVLDARAEHPGATLADLYDPDLMPPNLRKAHKALDTAVDRLYRPAPFNSERERVEHLFRLYEKMTASLLASPERAKRGRRALRA